MRTKRGKKKTRPTTQTPTLMIMVDESLESSSVLAPFWLRWNQPNDLAPFRFCSVSLLSRFSSSSSWTESSFEINELLESSAEAQRSLSDLRALTTKTETQNQTDSGRTEDIANQNGKKKLDLCG